MPIRPYAAATDLPGLRRCMIELQDYERDLDPRLPAGADIVDAYQAELFERCGRYDGAIFVAEEDGEIAGYGTILTKMVSDSVEDGDLVFGLVADLVVREEYRGRGLGRRLLARAEAHAMTHGVRHLRIGVLAGNVVARSLYTAHSFEPIYLQLEKTLGDYGNDDDSVPV